MSDKTTEEMCECGHERGDHWHRAAGVQECGIKDCICPAFASSEAKAAEGQEKARTATDEECKAWLVQNGFWTMAPTLAMLMDMARLHLASTPPTAALQAAQDVAAKMAEALKVVDSKLDRIVQRSTHWRFSNRDSVVGLEASSARDVLTVALAAYEEARRG